MSADDDNESVHDVGLFAELLKPIKDLNQNFEVDIFVVTY